MNDLKKLENWIPTIFTIITFIISLTLAYSNLNNGQALIVQKLDYMQQQVDVNTSKYERLNTAFNTAESHLCTLDTMHNLRCIGN